MRRLSVGISAKLMVVLPIVGLLAGGCSSVHRGGVGAQDGKETVAVRQRLDEIMDAAVRKDFDRLESYHLYGPKFTKFSPESLTRLDADAARKGERDGLSAAADLAMQIDDLKLDLFDEVAIATFILNYRFNASGSTIERSARSTLILVKVDHDWKIAHEHLSAVKSGP